MTGMMRCAGLCLAVLGVGKVMGNENEVMNGLKNEGQNEMLEAPVAKVVAKELVTHGHVRVDDYYWLREREDPEVIAYLEAENGYTEAVMGHAAAFEDALFEEIKGRIKQTDMSVPYKRDDYFYYSRYEEGKEYAFHCRKKGSLDGAEEVMLDANVMAAGHEYFAIGGRAVSAGQDILAYAVDTVGRRIYTIYLKNLTTGEVLEDTIANVTGNMAWANDNRTLFYGTKDLTTLRSNRIHRHVLGTDPSEDVLVFEETDDTFSTYVAKTKSRKYLMIASQQTLSTEFRYLDADDPEGEFKVFQQRERDHEYQIDHLGDRFYILTNHEAKNFRLMKTPVSNTAKTHWEEVIPHRADVLLGNFELFKNHLVVEERKDGLVGIRVMPWGEGADRGDRGDRGDRDEHYLDFGEPAYLAYVSTNPELDTQTLRFGYTSMTTPNSIFDYDMVTREKVLLKQEEVLGGFDSKQYRTERLFATAEDGTKVPISLVYRRDLKKNGGNPLLLYGYGSYGYSTDATFSSPRLSLVDRGFVYAIAHIRGGQELGRQWYEDGKLLRKINTFTDFIACGDHLAGEGYTSSETMFAMGSSAGGLLMGAVINLRPKLFFGVVSRVPFVDVVTTMLDSDIPLTTSEYDEWGNPNEKAYYDYILSYSPYDNVEPKAFPHMLVTTGLHDSQVQYWEPAKWVAKLRALKTDRNRLLLKTNMDAGHSGPSGRFKSYRDTAENYAFILDLAGITE